MGAQDQLPDPKAPPKSPVLHPAQPIPRPGNNLGRLYDWSKATRCLLGGSPVGRGRALTRPRLLPFTLRANIYFPAGQDGSTFTGGEVPFQKIKHNWHLPHREQLVSGMGANDWLCQSQPLKALVSSEPVAQLTGVVCDLSMVL